MEAVAGGISWRVLSQGILKLILPFAPPLPTTGGTRFLTYRGHTKQVYAVAWAPKGQLVASGGNDHIVKVWDATPPAGNDLFTYLESFRFGKFFSLVTQ